MPGLVTKCEKTKNRKGPVAREVGLQLYQPRSMVDMSIVRSNYKPIRRCSPSPNLRPLTGEADEPWGFWGIRWKYLLGVQLRLQIGKTMAINPQNLGYNPYNCDYLFLCMYIHIYR